MDDLAIEPVPCWYLRHGETDWNRRGLSQGSNDIPLNELGLSQARGAAVRLRDRGITSIVSLPVGRARVTAARGVGVVMREGLWRNGFKAGSNDIRRRRGRRASPNYGGGPSPA